MTTSATTSAVTSDRTIIFWALTFAALIVCVTMGVRHTFGLFLGPMTLAHQWSREAFSFAIALQNLVWGMSQPFAGLLADRFGARRVLWGAGTLYMLGLVGMAFAPSGLVLALCAGVLIGMAQSGGTYSVVFSALATTVPPARRSWAMGLVASAGSFGQFALVPVAATLMGGIGWFATLLVFAAFTLALLPLGAALTRGHAAASAQTPGQTAGEAIREALHERSFILLMAGYFVCGFQVVFIGVHLPTYLTDKGLFEAGTTALALIALCNIGGTYLFGHLGSLYPKRYLLAAIYFLRSVAIALFLLAPLSPLSVYLFAIGIGVLWLSTIPPTNAIIAQVFGVRYLGMLSGFVFFSHQIGSFLGVWLGGMLFDLTGNYNFVWGGCIVLGVVAALCNLPIDERSLAEQRGLPQTAS